MLNTLIHDDDCEHPAVHEKRGKLLHPLQDDVKHLKMHVITGLVIYVIAILVIYVKHQNMHVITGNVFIAQSLSTGTVTGCVS